MKKLFLTLLAAGITATAQVKVGTNPTTLATNANFQVEGTATTNQFVVLKNGNVGIGTTAPIRNLDVFADNAKMAIVASNENQSATLFFGTNAPTGVPGGGGVSSVIKTAIIAEGAGGFNRNNLHFALSSSADNALSTVATITDAKMTILNSGNVGIGTTAPNTSSLLDVTSTTKGFLPPRMTTAQQTAIASPAKGLVLYNTTLDCLQVNKGTPASPTWECIGASAAPTATADCNTTAFAGTYVSGTAMSGTNNYVVTVVNNSLSPVSVAMQSSDLVLSGVAGLAVGTPTPATLNLAGGASGTVSYPITGNPTACGTLQGVWTKISLTCTKIVIVSPANFILPSTGITYNSLGEASGFTANWSSQAGATGYTVEHSTTEAGPWTAFPSNPYTGTSAAITGLSGNSAYWLRVTIVGGGCAGSNSISNGPAAGCAAKINATTWKTFMCHNLGATTSLDPSVPVQSIHGNYYQWGRSTVVADASTGAGVIGGWNITPAANGSWLDASKTGNDPCPSGFRVPTKVQWDGVIANNTVSTTGSWLNNSGNFTTAVHFGPNASTKSLTLPAGGIRSPGDGSLFDRGSRGDYWCTTEDGIRAWGLFLTSTSITTASSNRSDGKFIRCIKE